MDGKGADGMGACAVDSPDDCGKTTTFSKFSVETIPGSACVAQLTSQGPAEPAVAPATNTTTTTVLVMVEEGNSGSDSGFQFPPDLVGPLGFFGGALCAVSAIAIFGCFQKQGMQRVPEAPTQRTLQQSQANSTSLVSMASVAEIQEGEQQA
mmetsp:Transcript_32471/g.63948  ORF Transcript_32471/g.63948 Transcript_32471/m.63948 type:complete len:152 (+) Transcript_32471:2-457(+)